MTTDERIAELAAPLDFILTLLADRPGTPADASIALACEVRALRLMLREEIREAAWPLKAWADVMLKPQMLIRTPHDNVLDDMPPTLQPNLDEVDALASRKAPDA